MFFVNLWWFKDSRTQEKDKIIDHDKFHKFQKKVSIKSFKKRDYSRLKMDYNVTIFCNKNPL